MVWESRKPKHGLITGSQQRNALFFLWGVMTSNTHNVEYMSKDTVPLLVSGLAFFNQFEYEPKENFRLQESYFGMTDNLEEWRDP